MCPAPAIPARGGPRRVRTLVADDEPLARDLVSNLVRRDPELELVAAAASGAEALAAIRDLSPDLVLLDVQMPCLDGVSVAEQLAGLSPAPYVIFVTAHDTYALKAFEVSVRDYIVKPIARHRFAAAVARAKRALTLAPAAPADAGAAQAMTVRSGEQVISVLHADIVWVAAANQYVRLHVADGHQYVVAKSLRQFAQGLDPATFMRIHRSTLINLAHLTSVLGRDGRYRVVMSDGTQHDVARNRKALVPDLVTRTRENARR